MRDSFSFEVSREWTLAVLWLRFAAAITTWALIEHALSILVHSLIATVCILHVAVLEMVESELTP